MKIKNLTPRTQKLVVKEITGEKRVYEIYLAPHGTTDIERMILVEPKEISGILEIEGMNILTPPVHEETEPVVDDTTSPVVENPVETSEPEQVSDTQETGDSFICDICGAEFGSARGLNSHKNRAHAEN